MSDHISRKELKQDKIKETIEHGAEAVISHGQFTLIVVLVALVVALGYGGWRFYVDRQTVEASAAFDTAMKAYQGRIGSAPDPADHEGLEYVRGRDILAGVMVHVPRDARHRDQKASQQNHRWHHVEVVGGGSHDHRQEPKAKAA